MADLMGGSNDIWMGGHDFVEGDWKWTDGTPFGYTKWWHGEPNDDGQEDCMSLRIGETWNDQSCHRENKFICKIMFAKISFPKNGIRQ